MNEAAHKELYEAARQGRLRKREDGVYWPRENMEVYCGYQIVRDFILDQDPIYRIVAGIAESRIDCSAWNQKRDSAPDLDISRGPFCTLDRDAGPGRTDVRRAPRRRGRRTASDCGQPRGAAHNSVEAPGGTRGVAQDRRAADAKRAQTGSPAARRRRSRRPT